MADRTVGVVTLRTLLDDGLELERVSCPIGVLLVIFESRPEVMANVSALAIKSGNAVILKGGKESSEFFTAMAQVLGRALASTQVPREAVQIVATRDAVLELLDEERHIDMVIPRGSNDLVRFVKSNTRIHVLGHADGICSVYLEASADAAMAVDVLVDAKTTYPAACNSVETLLVQEGALASLLPRVARALTQRGVELRCDAASLAVLGGDATLRDGGLLRAATPQDYETEHLSLTLAVRVVADVAAATAHINAHGSQHTDAILTADAAHAERFMATVDAAGVFWNASTRMADGMRFGFGAEAGVSTNKMHARGPVGLEGLTIYKYKLRGRGHVTAAYGEGGRRFKHERLL
jgi:glutamate-5-semialdehyde dehydrogenase